jgi:hypothetical protein
MKSKKNELHIEELLTEVIIGVSSRINKKALKEVTEDFHQHGDLNGTLKAYYNRVHGHAPDFYEFKELNSPEDYLEIRQDYGAKIYRKPYNYKQGQLEPIRQRDTGFGMIYGYHWVPHWSYLFNVDEYVRVNRIKYYAISPTGQCVTFN